MRTKETSKCNAFNFIATFITGTKHFVLSFVDLDPKQAKKVYAVDYISLETKFVKSGAGLVKRAGSASAESRVYGQNSE